MRCCEGTIGDGWCIDDIADAAEAPFVARIDCGRATETPATGSALFNGHGPPLWTFFRVVAPPQLRSPAAEFGTPLGVVDGDGVAGMVEDVPFVTTEDEFAR